MPETDVNQIVLGKIEDSLKCSMKKFSNKIKPFLHNYVSCIKFYTVKLYQLFHLGCRFLFNVLDIFGKLQELILDFLLQTLLKNNTESKGDTKKFNFLNFNTKN